MTRREELASPAALANLARTGFLMAQQSFMQVNFEVHHVRDRTGYLRELFHSRLRAARSPVPRAREGADGGVRLEQQALTGEMPRETLSSAANGVGLVIGTYAGELPRAMQRRRQGSDLPVALMVDHQSADVCLFQGTGWPNPTFLYESGQAFEGLILIEKEVSLWSSFHRRAIAELVDLISKVAADHDAPLLSLQCPVQMPPDAGDQEWRVPSVIGVRFSMALRGGGAELRLNLTEGFTRAASERGYGFWRADTRLGRRQGNWYQVCDYDESKVREQAEWARCDEMDNRCCLPVTFVGPARVGSTSAIISYLREYPNMGLLACSIILLDDLAFIHLQLAVHGVSEGGIDQFNEVLRQEIRSVHGDSSEVRTSAPQELLPKILPVVTGNPAPDPDPEVLGRLIKVAGRYQCLAGPAMLTEIGDSTDHLPLWFSWRAVGTDEGLVVPLIAFMDALQSSPLIVPDGVGNENWQHPNLDYLVCRDVGESRLRGKGKISLPRHVLHRFRYMQAETVAPRLCTSLEDAWRAELGRYALPGGVEIAVAWVEYRLNNSSPWL